MKVNPVLLIILDGFGCRQCQTDNAIAQAHKPHWDALWKTYPHTLIQASESAVGLPSGQMGNSEVGHLNIGAGRVVYQEFTRIDLAIQGTSFFDNPALKGAIATAKANGGALHILGLLSDGGVHSHENHIYAMLRMAAHEGLDKVFVHAFLDGRDTPPKSAETYLARLEMVIAEVKVGRIASIIGRYFAMDRDRRWQRVQSAYELISEGRADFAAPDAEAGLQQAYARGETDEFVKATAIVPPGTQPVRIEDGDAVVFMNFRSDRARQISRPFIEPDFSEFGRTYKPKLGAFCTLTGYSDEFNVSVAFPPERIRNGFGEYIAQLGLTQLRIAETEKYPHVTFFFNGGEETVYEGEERILVPSPDVATYDLQPEMSAYELTDKLVGAIESKQFDAIICNYANADMVGHTGHLDAAIKAIEVLDDCLGRVIPAMLAAGGEVVITADHGNAEMMMDEQTTQAHTAHTVNLVPLLYVGKRRLMMADNGALEDVSPTLLKLMGLPQPSEMTGRALIEFE
ncbi:MAG TPA: 2,3-bisphosphoglycerate-independent phosphoglycerate mutase [Betaproteobacteria bacterium]|nr:2,3-bisphosphoglycerate-independent phosphoglycerate mutase [Betaproteobacteria bacterium]